MLGSVRFGFVSVAVLISTLAVAEAGRRVLDGYVVWSTELVKDPHSIDLTWADAGSVDTLMRAIARDADVDPAWFYDRPSPASGVSPDWADARRTKVEPAANYVWNQAALNDGGLQAFLQKHKAQLDEIFTFRTPDGSAWPLYRFYPNLETGYGFTNRFGWRSRPIEAIKPPNVVRIGVLGDSTTGEYPRLVEHWLNLWAAREGLAVRFEVANASRPASGARDAAAILDFELGAVDADYVIVYGFGNGVYVADALIKLPEGIVKSQPPAPGTPTAAGRAWSRISDELGAWSRWSAAAGFLRGRMSGLHGARLFPEPAKPRTDVEFPSELNESSPDPAAIARHTGGGLMGLDIYMRSLDQVDRIIRERGIRLFVSTFRITAFEGMLLDRGDSSTQAVTYTVLNEGLWWPYTYAQISRLMNFYNRALSGWAQSRGHSVIPVNEQMPWRPDLYKDAMHETPSGDLLHAWIVLQQLIPHLRDDLRQGRLPRAARPAREGLDEYWQIARTPVADVLKAEAAAPPAPPVSPSAPDAADEIAGVFPLSALALAYEKARIQVSAVPVVTTASEPQAYAASIPLTTQGAALAGRGWVTVRVRVRTGRISLGILNQPALKFLSTASVGESAEVREVRLPIDDLSQIGSLMVSNDRPGESAASVAELHGVALMKVKQ